MQLTGQFFKYPSFRVTSRPAPDCTDYLLVLPFAIDLVKPTTIRTDKVMTLDMSASFMCFAVGVNHKGTASISRRSTCLGLDTNALFLAKADHMPSAYKPSRVRIRITAGKSGNFLPCHDFRTLVPNASETFACKEQHKKKYLLTSQKKAQKTWLYLVPTSLPCREYIYLQVLLSQRITHIRCRNTMKMQQTDSIQQATSVSFSFADTHKHHLMIHSTLTKPVQQKI